MLKLNLLVAEVLFINKVLQPTGFNLDLMRTLCAVRKRRKERHEDVINHKLKLFYSVLYFVQI